MSSRTIYALLPVEDQSVKFEFLTIGSTMTLLLAIGLLTAVAGAPRPNVVIFFGDGQCLRTFEHVVSTQHQCNCAFSYTTTPRFAFLIHE